jgi:hypothetical protein
MSERSAALAFAAILIALALAAASLAAAAPAQASACPGYYGMERVQATGIACHDAKPLVLALAQGKRGTVVALRTGWAWRCRWSEQAWPEATCRKLAPTVQAHARERGGVVRARMPRD